MTALFVRSWKFHPLCADTAGGWAHAAQEVLHKCAERVEDKVRRGALLSLWRQRLSVALQREGFRIMRLKLAAALGEELPLACTANDGLAALSVDDVECVPGVFGQE